MLLNCINKISTTKTNEKEQKAIMNNVYEQKKTQEVTEFSNGPFIQNSP